MATKKSQRHFFTTKARKLFAANADHLPTAARLPRIYSKPAAAAKISDAVTTDFFAFDDSTNSYGLNGLGTAVEMGDAVLGLVIEKMGASAPRWAAIRNASDPQIDSSGGRCPKPLTKPSRFMKSMGTGRQFPALLHVGLLLKTTKD